MAIVSGNKTHLNVTPSASTYTYSSHSQDVGSNGYLVVIVTSVSDFGQTISGATWNGVSMTSLQSGNVSADGANSNIRIFGLASPATGAKDLVVTWSASMLYNCSIQIFSFTGASGAGNGLIGTPTTTPNAQTMSITLNSMVIGVALSRYAISNIELPQNTARTLLQNIQVYLSQVATAISPSLALSGNQTFEANSQSNNVALCLIEIKEAVSASRRIFVIS